MTAPTDDAVIDRAFAIARDLKEEPLSVAYATLTLAFAKLMWDHQLPKQTADELTAKLTELLRRSPGYPT